MEYMKKMAKKAVSTFVCCLIITFLLAACVDNTSRQQSSAPPVAPPSAPSSQVVPVPAQNAPIRIMLPGGHTQLAEIIKQLALPDDIAIEFLQGAESEGYTAKVLQSLISDTPPDIIWLNNMAEFAEIKGENYFAQLNAQNADIQLQTIAETVPERMRLGGQSAVYGLPAGYVAQGYMINLDLIAALLNTTNKQSLLNNLYACSFEQWKMLIISLEEYLQKPGRIEITLADTKYFTHGQRPAIARGLRGMFAVADADASALLEGTLTATLNAPFGEELAIIEASAEELTGKIYPLLGSLLSALEFETLHMTRSEGALARGAAYAETWDKLTWEQATQLFSSGTALTMRGSSQTAIALEEENPQLAGKLALVPIKLPLMPRTQRARNDVSEDAQQDTASEVLPESASEADESTSGDTGTSETQANSNEEAMQAVATHNRRLWVAGAGAFYVNKNTDNMDAIATLLLRIFASKEGKDALTSLGIVPFAPYVAQNGVLQTQILEAAQGQSGALLPVQPASWLQAQTYIGQYVGEEMLDKDEWLEDEVDGFFSIASIALGLRVEVEG